ncbi:MAG: tRNA lysidine(34) synthetase TilS [Firmicutes bacterium]|nr:tRNA lysidine(34) synthetase TilS [Bacillota bacterium]
MDLKERVRRTIERYRLLARDDQVLVAVSGGPDSLALLYLLRELAPDFQLSLWVFHLNHLLRGRQAEAEAEFVGQTALKLGLPSTIERFDVRQFQKEKGLSLEEAARLVRYRFLYQTARENGLNRIALGHTRDDQAETVLLNILRGAGLEGLAGMPPARPVTLRELSTSLVAAGSVPPLTGIDDKTQARALTSKRDEVGQDDQAAFWLIRPLIEVGRAEIETYCREKSLQPRRDPSNLETRFRRNKIRLELLPALERDYNPRIRRNLARLAETLRLDYEWIKGLAHRRLSEITEVTAGPLRPSPGDFRAPGPGYYAIPRLALEIAGLRSDPPGLRRWVLRLALQKVRGSLQGIGQKHLEAVEALVMAPEGGREVHLPGVRVYRDYRFLTLQVQPEQGLESGVSAGRQERPGSRQPTGSESPPVLGQLVLPVPGLVHLPEMGIVIQADRVPLSRSGLVPRADQTGLAEAERDTLTSTVNPPGYSGKDGLLGWGRTGEWEAWLNEETLILPLAVRFRRVGDRFWPLGTVAPVKLKDFLIAQKVPRRLRDHLPLVVSGPDIVWIPGLRLSEGHKLKEDSRRAVRLICRDQGLNSEEAGAL